MKPPEPPNPLFTIAGFIRRSFRYDGGVWFIFQPAGMVYFKQIFHCCQFPVMEPENEDFR